MTHTMDKTANPKPGWTEDQVISFPNGLPGFESARRFIIYTDPQHDPFCWMESVDEHKIRFVIINPMVFRPDYQPKVSKSDLESLSVQTASDLLMYAIVTLKEPLNLSTANLMGPLFVNIRERKGKQVIIENDAYSLQERIIS